LYKSLQGIEISFTCYAVQPTQQSQRDFHLTMVEGKRFLPSIEPIPPTLRLQTILEELPWAIAVDKARSEVVINPVCWRFDAFLINKSVFSGEESMWMRKQDSMTFVISSVAPRTTDGRSTGNRYRGGEEV